ncbi:MULTISPECIES: protease HtpX [Idiomarina]|uniref:protease HtpX n=1 Tax=Idiomarinaceae TaxID=267893 RepID=UPI00129AD72F|nr:MULTISPECIES: protease HtpX [Idiomarina]MDX1525120.1 protease HtpX [Pseudidiomarina maritima]MRJ40902.1 protease HtpX [Idiomarina sp. FeN1]NCU56706.1 protease HtpX [Idiomarina sp. FenA--70]NCU59086.1 protease HtpX [Idiomarina sp. FenBw--71]UUN14423.1 protease HtpX [Idiomarina loihiensis]
MLRIALFLATNLAILLVLGVVMNVLMPALGVDTSGYSGLLIFAAVFGFGGAFISLAMSKWMAKRAVGAQVISQPRNQTEQWLLRTVQRQSQQAGIPMPEVAIYDSPEPNAFATGASKKSSLVAVSTGLMRNMTQAEVEAVLAHEISHIANGDMVTLTLIQGVVNTFVIFFARVIAGVIDNATRSNSQNGQGLGGIAYFAIVMVLELVFGILASIIVMWFSRQREFRADAGAAKLVGAHNMVAALRRLQGAPESTLDGSMMAFGIQTKRSFSELFMSHPPLAKRIQALQQGR